jgi:hypothetical protein
MTIKQSYPTPKTFTASLELIATSYALRCDAKFFDTEVLRVIKKIRQEGCFQLGDFLPTPFVKGIQPNSLDQPTDDSVPVINTLSIQNLAIRVSDCRHIAPDDFDALSDDRRLKSGDVLLTVDGGVSIGKAVLFNLDGDFTVDSHVVILRPKGLSGLGLVYLLASPLGQMQFRRAESGASGQTTVTEDDVRRFIFPRAILKTLHSVVTKIEAERKQIGEQRRELDRREAALWKQLDKFST